jgi:hypothetical protein
MVFRLRLVFGRLMGYWACISELSIIVIRKFY